MKKSKAASGERISDSQLRDIKANWIIWLSFALLVVGLLGFNHIIELRAAEGRRALVTFEMMQAGDMLTPRLHGEIYYNKPPLFNWVLAFFFVVFDSMKEWILRLPGILSMLLTAIVIFKASHRAIGKNAALLAAGMYLSMTDLLFYGSVNAGEIDLFYSLICILQVFAIYFYFEKEQWYKLFLISYFLMAVGALTKGVPSIAFQGITLLVYFLYRKKFWKLFSIPHVAGFVLGFGLVAGYFYLYDQQHDSIAYLLNTFKQASQRSANVFSLVDIIGHMAIFPFHFLRHLLPWSLLLFLLINRSVRQSLLSQPFVVFVLIFIASNILVYWTAPDMRIRYMYMFFPVFAILFGRMLDIGVIEAPQITKWIYMVFKVAASLAGLALLGSVFASEWLSTSQIVISTLIGISILIISYRMWKQTITLEGFWNMVLVLAIARMVYNLVGMPVTADNLPQYEEMTLDMIEEAGDARIHYYGGLIDIKPKLELFGNVIYEKSLYIPDDYAADFAYYDAVHKNRVMAVKGEIIDGDYYLLYQRDLKPGFEVLDTIPKMMGGRTMYFAKGITPDAN